MILNPAAKQKTFKITRPLDMHVHLREGELLKQVLPYTANYFAKALVMPNLTDAVDTRNKMVDYRSEIMNALIANHENKNISNFEPLMTFKITPTLKPAEIDSLANYGATAGKLYPDGVTTNSAGGVVDYEALRDVFLEMQNYDLVLCLHGETPGAFCLDREKQFIRSTLTWLIEQFPKLRIVLEHVSTAYAVDFIKDAPNNVAATITAHHLEYTLDDIIGGALNPHAFCKPIAKHPDDRYALRKAAMFSHKFFFGSDSAPHTTAKKECDCGAAGVFSAPTALPYLLELFQEEYEPGCWANFDDFTVERAVSFYKLTRPVEKLVVVEEDNIVRQAQYVYPFLRGRTLKYRVMDIKESTEYLKAQISHEDDVDESE